jgi:hypothetical protein
LSVLRRLSVLPIFCLLASLPGRAAAAEPLHAPVRLSAPVQDKNFYLLSMFERTPDARDAVKAEPALARIAAERLAALDKAAKTCDLDLDCYASAFQWSDAQARTQAAHWRAYFGLHPRCAAWPMELCGTAECMFAIKASAEISFWIMPGRIAFTGSIA